MSTFDDFMIDKAVKDDAEVVRLRKTNREMLTMLERLNEVIARGGDFRMGPLGPHRGLDSELAALIQKAKGGQ